MSSVLNPGAVTTVSAGGSPNKSPVAAQSMAMQQHVTFASQTVMHTTQTTVGNPTVTHVPTNMGNSMHLNKISTTNIPQQMLHEQLNIEQITNISIGENLTNVANISDVVEQNFTIMDSFQSNVNQNVNVASNNFPASGLHSTGQIPVTPHLQNMPNVTNVDSIAMPISDSLVLNKTTEKVSEESTITQSNGTMQILNQSENICSVNAVSGSLPVSDIVLQEHDPVALTVANINPSITTAHFDNIQPPEPLDPVTQVKDLPEVLDNAPYQIEPVPITSTDDLVTANEKQGVTQSDDKSALTVTSPNISTTPNKNDSPPKADDATEENTEERTVKNVPSDSVTSTTTETPSAVAAISTPSRPVSAVATSTTGPSSPTRAVLPAKVMSTMRLATVNKPRGINRRRVADYRSDRNREAENGVGAGSGVGDDKRKSKRVRTTTQMYQSPIPELALLTKMSASQARAVKPQDDKLIAFYKNEFLAVRNTEGGFFICQAVRNVYKTSTRIRIRWLSQDNSDTSDVYSPDFYDFTEFDCILTNLNMERVDKGLYRLPEAELDRTKSILQRALDVEQGVAIKPCVTEEHPDGLDLSLYKDESQLDKKVTRKKRTTTKSKTRTSKYESEDSNDDENDSYDEDDSGSDYSHTPKKTPKKAPYTPKRTPRGKAAVAKPAPKSDKKEINLPRVVASTSASGSSGTRAERAKRRSQPLEADSPSASVNKKAKIVEEKKKEPKKRNIKQRQPAKSSPVPSTSRNIRGSSTLVNPTPSTSRGPKRGGRI